MQTNKIEPIFGGFSTPFNVNVSKSNHSITELSDLVLEGLKRYNEYEPKVFVRGGMLCDVFVDEKDNVKIRNFEKPEMLMYYADISCNFKKINSENKEVKARLPIDVVKNILVSPKPKTRIPALNCVVESPFVSKDGSFITAPGYNSTDGIYFKPRPGYKDIGGLIPETPTRGDIDKAVSNIRGIFSDFIWGDDASEDNLLGHILTCIMRPNIDGCVPMHLNDKPQMGCGGSLLDKVVARLTTGDVLKSRTMPGGRAPNEEMKKTLNSIFKDGTYLVCFDNIDGKIDSPSLASAITSRKNTDRILGTTNDTSFDVNVVWCGNGINIDLAGDLPRRVYVTRILSDSAAPYLKTNFKIPELETHVKEHRYEYLVDLFTIIRGYYQAGCPKPKITPKLGGFEEWHELIGGIMEFAGRTKFLANTVDIINSATEQNNDDELLVSEIYNLFGEREFTATDIQNSGSEAIKKLLPKWIDDNPRKLGKYLSKVHDKVYSTGLKMEKSGLIQHKQYYTISKVN
jgi:hypothetical protein